MLFISKFNPYHPNHPKNKNNFPDAVILIFYFLLYSFVDGVTTTNTHPHDCAIKMENVTGGGVNQKRIPLSPCNG